MITRYVISLMNYYLYKQRPMITNLYLNYSNRPLTGIEIGTASGLNAKRICEQLNMRTLYCIDPWDRYDGYKLMHKVPDLSVLEVEARKNLRGLPVKFIKQKSEDALQYIPDYVDFVYIDGNHEYEYVKRDIELYKPRCHFIGGHDIDCRAGVKQSVEDTFGNHYRKIKCDWWVRNG